MFRVEIVFDEFDSVMVKILGKRAGIRDKKTRKLLEGLGGFQNVIFNLEGIEFIENSFLDLIRGLAKHSKVSVRGIVREDLFHRISTAVPRGVFVTMNLIKR